jgi:hypothetical protein
VRLNHPLNSTSIMVNRPGHHEDCSLGGSGIMSSPSRFQHDLLLEHIDNIDEDNTMRLRNPQNANGHNHNNEMVLSPMINGDKSSGGKGVER